MTKLIINADDLGYNEGRSCAILEFLSRGLISNTTLMVNQPFADEAVVALKKQKLDRFVGLHLNLTEGYPLTEAIRNNPVFCGSDGRFNAVFHRSFRMRLFLMPHERLGIREEVEAQLKKYCDYGLTELHLDSHHHAHTDLSLARIIVPLAIKYGFKSMRLSANLRPGGVGLIKGFYKGVFNRYPKQFLRQVDFFSGLGAVDTLWASLAEKTIEMMVHPLHCCDGSGDDSDRLGEYETKISDLENFFRKHYGQYHLLSYADL